MVSLPELFKITEQLQQNCIVQLKKHFRGRLSPLLCGIFSLGTLPPLESRKGRGSWIYALPPSKTEVEGSRMQPLIHALEGLYTAIAVTSQTPQGFWSMMP